MTKRKPQAPQPESEWTRAVARVKSAAAVQRMFLEAVRPGPGATSSSHLGYARSYSRPPLPPATPGAAGKLADAFMREGHDVQKWDAARDRLMIAAARRDLDAIARLSAECAQLWEQVRIARL